MARFRTTAVAMDAARLGYAQGYFNIVGGLWPILSLRSFEAVFGPKADRWLEYTVGGLLVTNGLVQLRAARQAPGISRAVGVGTAATLLTIDVVYVPKGTIRWTYLLDAAMEIGWLVLWQRTVAHRSHAGPARQASAIKASES